MKYFVLMLGLMGIVACGSNNQPNPCTTCNYVNAPTTAQASSVKSSCTSIGSDYNAQIGSASETYSNCSGQLSSCWVRVTNTPFAQPSEIFSTCASFP